MAEAETRALWACSPTRPIRSSCPPGNVSVLPYGPRTAETAVGATGWPRCCHSGTRRRTPVIHIVLYYKLSIDNLSSRIRPTLRSVECLATFELGVSVVVERSPSFSFYPKDWLSDVKVRTMSHPARALYVDLLCFCWTEETLPADPVALAQLLGVPARTLGKWWPKLRACFEETDGRLRHPQLDREREDQAAWRAARAEAGRKGAARRWQSHRSAMAKPPPEHRTTQDETMAEDVPGDGTRTPEPMLGNGIAVRSSQFANVARFARNTHRGGEDSYQAVSQSVRRFLLEEPQLLMQEPPDWVELKEGAKDRCRADGVTWTRSAVIARAIDSELTKFRKGVGEVARKVKGTGQ